MSRNLFLAMKQPPIPVLNPELFVRQFLPAEAHEQVSQLTDTPLTPFSPTNFFAIMRIEDFARQIRFPIPASRSFHYDFLLVTGGSIQRTYGTQPTTIGPMMFSAYAAGTILSTDACSADATGYYVLFDAECVLATLKNPHALDGLRFFQPNATPVIRLDEPTCQDWLTQLGRLEQAFRSDRPDRQAYIGALLYGFLLDVQQQHGQQLPVPVSAAAQLTNRFQVLLTRHVLSKRSVAEYADLLAVTPNYLNKCMKETTGKPASLLIAEVLVLEAKVLLGQPQLPVSEVAYRLSFDDPSYFARFFKKHTGMSTGNRHKLCGNRPDLW